MPLTNGVFTPPSFDDALAAVVAAAPASIQFSPGNPPELVLANMLAEADVIVDENNGEILAMMMSPVGAMIDAMNPNNPRNAAEAATGYIAVANPTGVDIIIPANSVCTASTGQTYKTGSTVVTVSAHGSLDVLITAITAGVSGNISSGLSFSVAGSGSLTATNPLPLLSGADAESDAIYLNRLISEKTEYGTQNGSVAVETELKKYYSDARIYVNNSQAELTTPVPVPVNGYNVIVKTPSGSLAQAAELAQVFKTLASRLEFVNAQNLGNAKHVVKSGTVYNTGVPQSYYCTVAQAVKTTIAITINVRASSHADRSELITQANAFAVAFLNRLMALLSGINGTTDITYSDSEYVNVVTAVDIAGSLGVENAIAPAFGIATIIGLVNSMDTMAQTPQIVYDSTPTLSVTIDPQVGGVSPVVLSIGGAKQFIDFENDSLFSDSTSWYDRFVFIDPANVSVTVQVSAWM